MSKRHKVKRTCGTICRECYGMTNKKGKVISKVSTANQVQQMSRAGYAVVVCPSCESRKKHGGALLMSREESDG